MNEQKSTASRIKQSESTSYNTKAKNCKTSVKCLLNTKVLLAKKNSVLKNLITSCFFKSNRIKVSDDYHRLNKTPSYFFGRKRT